MFHLSKANANRQSTDLIAWLFPPQRKQGSISESVLKSGKILGQIYTLHAEYTIDISMLVLF